MRHYFSGQGVAAPESVPLLAPGMAVSASPGLLVAPSRCEHGLAPGKGAAVWTAVPLSAIAGRADADLALTSGAFEHPSIGHGFLLSRTVRK